jgi:hypothetical protein
MAETQTWGFDIAGVGFVRSLVSTEEILDKVIS